MIRDSVEYLGFTLTDRDGADLSGDTVTVAITPRGTAPTTWLPCTHTTGTKWRTSSPVTWSTANYPLGSYQVFAKVADTPEVPLADLGTLYIR